MGNCGSSKPATVEEKQEICKVCAKDMLNLCIDDALASPDKIKVAAPPALDQIREASAALKSAAADAAARAEGEEEEEEPESGGMFGSLGGLAGGLVGKVLGAASDAISFAADMGAKAISKALSKSAELLDKAIEQVEEPMTDIGQEIVTEKKAELSTGLKEYVRDAPVPNAEQLCMSNDSDAITKFMMQGEAAKQVADKLKTVVEGKLGEHKVIKAWDECIGLYNKLCGEVEKLDLGDSVKLPPIELDLQMYICEQCGSQLGTLMGTAEGTHRASPANKGSFPDIFEKVFKTGERTEKDELLLSDYKAVTKDQQK